MYPDGLDASSRSNGMIDTTEDDKVPVPGVDVPNYGKQAMAAQVEGRPLPPLSEVIAREHGGKVGANATQHGGTHYKDMVYEHWDWVAETRQPYHVGCATKYLSRYRNKNGLEDLKKAQHYLQKCDELDIYPGVPDRALVEKFVAQLPSIDATVVRMVLRGDYGSAMQAIDGLMTAFSRETE